MFLLRHTHLLPPRARLRTARGHPLWSGVRQVAIAIVCCAMAGCEGEVQTVDRERAYALQGWIGPPMAHRAAAALAAGHRRFTIDSRGGEVDAALEIGRLIKMHDGRLQVAAACMSACIMTLMIVPNRHAGRDADLRLHRAADFNGGNSSLLRLGDKVVAIDAAVYGATIYRALGVPADLVERDTAGVNTRRLSGKDLERMGVRP